VPGPAHLLEMKEEIWLSAEQIMSIENLYQTMKQKAIPIGFELIELEKRLNKGITQKCGKRITIAHNHH
jgi:hypothetical protein